MSGSSSGAGFRIRPSESGSPIVAMMQPTKSFARKNATGRHGASSSERCSLRKAEMRAVQVIVVDVFREQALEMRLSE
jgi:hypothetical protein